MSTRTSAAWEPPDNPADAWPRGAVAFSVVVLLAGLVMVLVGLGQAGDRSSAIKAATVLAPPVMGVLAWLVMHWLVGAWLEGRTSPGLRGGVLTVSVVVAVALFLAARSDAFEPPGVAALGGTLVGLMIGNIFAIRRARRASSAAAAADSGKRPQR